MTLDQASEILRRLDALYTGMVLIVAAILLLVIVIGGLAAWSVQTVNIRHQREFKLILELLAKVLPHE